MRYSSFWQRFSAYWIDAFVLMPFMVLGMWLRSLSRESAFVAMVFWPTIAIGYHLYCHARWGQTVGKRVMGIWLVRVCGEAVTWREAWLRSSVDIWFAVLRTIAAAVALSRIADASFHGHDWMHSNRTLTDLEPEWLHWIGMASTAWAWSELIVMLFNRQRRALHDYLAGTMVVQHRPLTASASAAQAKVL